MNQVEAHRRRRTGLRGRSRGCRTFRGSSPPCRPRNARRRPWACRRSRAVARLRQAQRPTMTTSSPPSTKRSTVKWIISQSRATVWKYSSAPESVRRVAARSSGRSGVSTERISMLVGEQFDPLVGARSAAFRPKRISVAKAGGGGELVDVRHRRLRVRRVPERGFMVRAARRLSTQRQDRRAASARRMAQRRDPRLELALARDLLVDQIGALVAAAGRDRGALPAWPRTCSTISKAASSSSAWRWSAKSRRASASARAASASRASSGRPPPAQASQSASIGAIAARRRSSRRGAPPVRRLVLGWPPARLRRPGARRARAPAARASSRIRRRRASPAPEKSPQSPSLAPERPSAPAQA